MSVYVSGRPRFFAFLIFALTLAPAAAAASSERWLETPSGTAEVTVPLVVRSEVDSFVTESMRQLGLAPVESRTPGWLWFGYSHPDAIPEQLVTLSPGRKKVCAVLRTRVRDGWRILAGFGHQAWGPDSWDMGKREALTLQSALEAMRDSIEVRGRGPWPVDDQGEPGIVRVALGGAGPVAAASHGVWVLVPDSAMVLKLDPVTLDIVARVPLPAPGRAGGLGGAIGSVAAGLGVSPPGAATDSRPISIAATARAVLVLLGGGREVAWIDPAGLRVTRTMKAPVRLQHLAGSESDVWGASDLGKKLVRFPDTAEPPQVIRLPWPCEGLASLTHGILVTGGVVMFDASSSRPRAEVQPLETVDAAAESDSGVWVAGFRPFKARLQERLVFYDHAGGRREVADLSSRSERVALVASRVWILAARQAGTGGLTCYDPSSGSVNEGSVGIGGMDSAIGPWEVPVGFAATSDAIWITEECGGWLVRIDPRVWLQVKGGME